MNGIDPIQLARDIDDYAEDWETKMKYTEKEQKDIDMLRCAAEIIRENDSA